MLELYSDTAQTFRRSYAGDTYNSAVYAKRVAPQLDVSFLTAVGKDTISDDMLSTWSSEGINTSQVLRSPDAIPGLYVISTDEGGERSFTYWRKDSAATQMMTLIESQIDSESSDSTTYHCDCVYFSGISLAILSDEEKGKLLNFISELRQHGATVAFDPNYRARMWQSVDHACHWIERAYSLCDIGLPGLDDHSALFSHQSSEEIHSYLDQLGVAEKVIKCGEQGMYGSLKSGEQCHIPFVPVDMQVDSTAAGDSFAGTYLAKRLTGETVEDAIKYAAAVAGYVVQHRGAIVDRRLFQTFCESYL